MFFSKSRSRILNELHVFFRRFFNLFVFGFLFTIIKKTYDLLSSMVKKMFIEIRLCNLMTELLKGKPKSFRYTW